MRLGFCQLWKKLCISTMTDDTPALLFELARRAQAARLRRRRRGKRAKKGTKGDRSSSRLMDSSLPDGSLVDSLPLGRSSSARSTLDDSLLARSPPDRSQRADDPPRQSAMQRRGSDYEEQALELLIRGGLIPLARNLRCRTGEIDLAMRDGETLVLVEVRARVDRRFGGAAASVDWAKQARLVRAACCLLPRLTARHWRGREPRVRFDVVAFEIDAPIWLKHAFEAPISR